MSLRKFEKMYACELLSKDNIRDEKMLAYQLTGENIDLTHVCMYTCIEKHLFNIQISKKIQYLFVFSMYIFT